ncbi:hypothetical protein PHYPSEUDO_005331 [Phytophthora pseudosyringae]|uniref:Uncharacterized protein n=1 Tax=Phytophthora pseudosyringae TaxID=221518 RepID=A0A8T1VL87_9STRA|nr:hypothetical protein PHYPSEUDO_005331 [Phytophthora pseudosyringae]
MNVRRLLSAPPNSPDSTATQHKSSNAKIGIPFLLCGEPDNQNEHQPDAVVCRPHEATKRAAQKAKRGKRPLPPAHSTPSTLSVIPDKDRKRSYRLSTKQRVRREENGALESRMYNLTLDVNNLKQEVRYLQERRDLHFTRIVVARQHAQTEAVGMVAQLFRLFCDETCGTNEVTPDDRSIFLSRVHSRLTDRCAGGRDGVPHFMLSWRNFKALFTHRSYIVRSIRLVSHVGPQEDAEDEDPRDASCCAGVASVLDEARRRCGPGGGCVVESVGAFAGRLKRDTIATISPRLLQDETLGVRLVGQKLSCPLRMTAYFDADGQLVDHVAEFDVIGALDAVVDIR